jgi:hypothetical protein
MIDLGKWASGAYVVSTPINDPDDLDAVGYSEGPDQPKPRPRADGQDKEHQK